MDDPANCVVLVPVGGGGLVPDCDAGLRELERRGYPVRRVYGYAAVDEARSRMATAALADGFAELMWIDADVAFDPAAVDRLRGHGLPFTCGLYPKKGRRAFAAAFRPGTEVVRFGAGGGLVEVLYCGFGFVHTRREVYERVARAADLPACNRGFGAELVPYFAPLVAADGRGEPWYLGEDYAFCERARRAGLAVVADTTIRLWHVGPYRYGWEDAGRAVERYADYTFRPAADQKASPAE